MEPVGEGIREELHRLGVDSSAAPDQNDTWLAAVGPEIARNAWPARTQADGTLIVHVRDAIWAFEPRILRETVRVTAIQVEETTAQHNTVSFLIEGDLWAQPYPERLYFRTELDLEAGEIRVIDQSGAR